MAHHFPSKKKTLGNLFPIPNTIHPNVSMYIILIHWKVIKRGIFERANISHDMLPMTPQIDNSIVWWFRCGKKGNKSNTHKKNKTYCKFVNRRLFLAFLASTITQSSTNTYNGLQTLTQPVAIIVNIERNKMRFFRAVSHQLKDECRFKGFIRFIGDKTLKYTTNRKLNTKSTQRSLTKRI